MALRQGLSSQMRVLLLARLLGQRRYLAPLGLRWNGAGGSRLWAMCGWWNRKRGRTRRSWTGTLVAGGRVVVCVGGAIGPLRPNSLPPGLTLRTTPGLLCGASVAQMAVCIWYRWVGWRRYPALLVTTMTGMKEGPAMRTRMGLEEMMGGPRLGGPLKEQGGVVVRTM